MYRTTITLLAFAHIRTGSAGGILTWTGGELHLDVEENWARECKSLTSAAMESSPTAPPYPDFRTTEI